LKKDDIPFEYLEHTADVMFRAYGKTAEDMLENAAKAMVGAMVDPSTVESRMSWEVALDAESLEGLVYQWLSELLFIFDSEGVIFSTFDVKLKRSDTLGGGGNIEGGAEDAGSVTMDEAEKFGDAEEGNRYGWGLQAKVGGERIDRSRHPFVGEVKAVTLHKFMVTRNDMWMLQAILDM
jgi:SHS2 domain-containing protein